MWISLGGQRYLVGLDSRGFDVLRVSEVAAFLSGPSKPATRWNLLP